MLTVTNQFLQAARFGTRAQTCSATLLNPLTNAVTVLPIEDGTVTVDSTSKVRRVLSLKVPGTQDLWDALSVVGGQVTVHATTSYAAHLDETAPLGVFELDQDTLGYGPGGTIQMTAPDRWNRVQRCPLISRSSVAGNTVQAEIQRLVEGAWAGASVTFPGWATMDTTSVGTVGSMLWADGDREKAALDLAGAHGLDVYFNAYGLGVIRLTPTASDTTPAVWVVDAGRTGVMVAADRTRDRSRTRNCIRVSYTGTDPRPDLVPQYVQNTTLNDPLSVNGPLGTVIYERTSPYYTSTAQMVADGLTTLTRELGSAQQVSVTAAPNYALEDSDVIDIVYPALTRTKPQDTEKHVIEQVVHPLVPTAAQTMRMRSTRPDTDGV